MHEKLTIEPWVVSPSGIAPELLDEDAVRTVQRLQGRHSEAYFVGGCVRDILLGRKPKDFDIATAARPQQVKRTFPRNCRIIGRRFKLAHLHFDGGRKILEVSTFRRTPEENGDGSGAGEDGEEADLLITHDNEFGSAEEDALRRDFTVNALFLDPLRDRIIDYVGGMRDLEERVIRTIGDPVVRFREDPVRILRAAKFAGRLGFHVAPSTLEAMAQVAPDLRRSAPPRLLEEILRLLRGGHALDSFQLLRDVGAMPVILPLVGSYLEQAPAEERIVFWRLLEALDGRVHAGNVPSSPVLLGTLFTRPVSLEAERRPHDSPTIVAEQLLGDLTQTLRLPRRDAGFLKRICSVQSRFAGRGGKRFRADAFARDPFFPAALELFELTCQATGFGDDVLGQWRARAPEGPVGREREDDRDDEREAPELASPEADEATLPPEDREADQADAEAYGPEDGEGESAGATTEPETTEPSTGEGGRRKRRRRRGRRGRNRDRREGEGEGGAQAPSHDAPSHGETERGEGEPHESIEIADAEPTERESRPQERAPQHVQQHRQPRDARRGHEPRHGRDQRGPEQRGPAPRPQHGQPQGQQQGGQEGRRKRRRGRNRDGREEQRPAAAAPQAEPTPRGEAPNFDRSILDQAMDPKEVPTFGALVEGGKGPKRRKPPRITVEEELGDPYRPPPHRTDGDGPPPPPPPPPSDHDVFGDW